ncbi:MAG: DUF4126 domain-containing protein [Planctomycetota bacterium]
MQITEVLLAVSLGIGLAAAAGIRVFVPMIGMSLAAASGHLTLGPSMDWLGSPLACIILGVATAVEITAFYVPWVDNALDALASPGAIVAGSIVAAAATSQVISMDPAMHWTIGIIAGGGTAGVVQATTVATRAASTLVSGGVTNPVVSTVEVAAASTLSIAALLLPILVAALVLGVLLIAVVVIARRRRAAPALAEPTSVPSM